jgi:hypothetical protein
MSNSYKKHLIKLFNFSINILSLKKKLYKNIYNFLQIIKFSLLVKNFNIFLPVNFNINTFSFFSLWIDGFITNFKILRWSYYKFLKCRYLSNILINLTWNEGISTEIKSNQIPLISLNNKHNFNNYYYDYTLTETCFFLKNNIDNMYYYILLFNVLKKWKKNEKKNLI